MKLRETIVLLLVLSLALVPIVSQGQVRSQSQGNYSESINVYSAGSSSYSLVTMDKLNSTSAALTSAESTSGLNGYRLVALGTQSFISDYQIFGPDGYNVLNIPYLPTQGVFLAVNASTESAVAPLLSYFDGILGTNLTLISSGQASYTYFGSVDFTGVAVPALYKLVPTGDAGFTSVFSEAILVGLPAPSITLLGSKNGTTFDHSISLGAAASGVIETDGSLDFLKVLGGTNSTVTASLNSTSSEVVVHSLDGLISSTDSAAAVSRSTSSFSSVYSLAVSPGDVAKPNVTIDNVTPTLNAYRTVSLSSGGGNDVLSVTLWLSNTAATSTTQNMTVDKVTVDDNWWQSYPSVFKLSAGNQSYDTTVPQILPGDNTTLVYTLIVVSASPSEIVIPAASVGYSYVIGNQTVQKQTTLNEVDLQLNGNVDPAMNIVVQPLKTYLSGSPLGTNASYVITIINGGSAPATDIKVAGRTFPNVPADSSLPSFDVPVNMTSLIQRNFTETFTLTWSTPSQQTENITSNSVTLILSHAAMAIPYVEVGTTDAVTAQTLSSRQLNVTYALYNEGSADAGTVTATQALPAGVTCSVESNGSGDVTCSGGQATFAFSSIEALATKTVVLTLNFSQNDYVIPPLNTTSSYKTTALHSAGEAFGIAAGLVATKSFSPGIVFPGMKSVVTVGLTNDGSQTIYNVTLSSSADEFDSISASTASQKTFASVAPHGSETFSYNVTVSKELSGNLTAVPLGASFLLAGNPQSLSLGQANLLVYKPLSLSAEATPSNPSTGKDFSVTFTITNDAPVAVSNVDFNWTLPAGVSVASGAQSAGRLVTDTVPSLAANSNDNFTLTLSADIGLTMNTGDSHLSYQYAGATLSGTVSPTQIAVKQDVTTNFAVPIVLAILIALAALVYVRRISSPAVKA